MKKLSRVSGLEVENIKQDLALRFLSTESVWFTQREAFQKFMPEIYVLREMDGLTYKEITEILKSYGLKLPQSSVQHYYRQFLEYVKTKRASELEKIIKLREEIREEFEGVEISMLAEKAREWRKRKRDD